jgi:lipopolysaccharide transport system ATP-binding protein
MSADLAVRAFGVSKRYVLGEQAGGYALLTERLSGALRRDRASSERLEHWALRDVDFEVERGSTFGIVGHNGAGKSTLLKILSRVTAPTTGGVDLDGRVGALLEVGTGFHAELTGAENVYLNGALLGMNRHDVARRFDEIVEFSGVERFIHTPVKRYSSGMYLRLAFAVAAHLEPDILIVDEVLSVGDLAFQEKCLDRMEAVAGEGRTVLFVSHNLAAVSRLCERAILLVQGRKVAEGTADEVLDAYVRGVQEVLVPQLDQRVDREGSGRLRFLSVGFEVDGVATETVRTGDDVTVVIRYDSVKGDPLLGVAFTITITTLFGDLLLTLDSETAGAALAAVPGTGEVRCRVPAFPLPAGTFALSLAASQSGEVLDLVVRATELFVAAGDFYGSGRVSTASAPSVLIQYEWNAA